MHFRFCHGCFIEMARGKKHKKKEDGENNSTKSTEYIYPTGLLVVFHRVNVKFVSSFV